MTTLAKDQPRDFYEGKFSEIPVIAADIIYQGAAVGAEAASGFARPLVAGDPFLGFAELQVDNSAGGDAAKHVRVRKTGMIKLAISGLAITDIGKDVYASDDNTFILTAAGNTRIGHVQRFVATGFGVVAFNTVSGVESALTDSTGGAAADTLAALVGVDVAAAGPAQVALVSEVQDAVASLAAKINYLIGRLNN